MISLRCASFLFFGIVFASPHFLFASAGITEIMYDLPGTDTGREWLEVHNTGNEDISFSTWKLFENSTNHGLTLFQGVPTTTPNGFVLIADDPAKFLADNPQYSGTLFKSSFSLSNTGETLELRESGVVVHQSTYASSAGAQGDGNSLHKTGNEWQATTPTPGSEAGMPSSVASESSSPGVASAAPEDTAGEQSPSAPPASSPPAAGGGSTWTFKPRIFVNAFVPQTGIAGAPVTFDAAAVGEKREPIPNARYVWSFGDGGTLEGKRIQHTYHYPASYVVMVTAASGEWNATDRKEITVTAPELVIGRIKEGSGGFIEVRNNGTSEVDLSGWLIGSGSGFFTIPHGTLIGTQKSIPFPAAITALSAEPTSTTLLYPNGNVVTRYIETPVTPESIPETHVQTESPFPPVTESVALAQSSVQEPEPAPHTDRIVSPAPAAMSARQDSDELLGAAGATKQSTTPWMLGATFFVAVSVGGYVTMLLRQREPNAAEKLRKEAATFDIVE